MTAEKQNRGAVRLEFCPATTRQQRMQLRAPQHDEPSCKSSRRANARFDVKVLRPSRFGERIFAAKHTSSLVNLY
jgi:hypothetical protein